MTFTKPYVLSIAGHDPSGGAGVLADIKTFEACGVYGFGVVTALTFQNDVSFEAVEWIAAEKIIRQVAVLQKRFKIDLVKIGLIESYVVLQQVVLYLKKSNPGVQIIFDPIVKASAGFSFHDGMGNFMEILPQLHCITPNIPEAGFLFGEHDLHNKINAYSRQCSIFLKGGHSNETEVSTDTLFTQGQAVQFTNKRLPKGEKHGSGCVLSSALTAYQARWNDLFKASAAANTYTHQFLASTQTLLGHHEKLSL